MSHSYEWKSRMKQSAGDNLGIEHLPRTDTKDHPLKNIKVERIPRRILGSVPSTGRTTPIANSILEPLSRALEGVDPLTAFAIEELDPLSKMAAEAECNGIDYTKMNHAQSKSRMQPWSMRRNTILSKFTTSEKLTIITSFLSEGDKIVVKTQSTAVDKIQHRLEQLDTFEDGTQKKLNVNQSEYVKRIEELSAELVSAWESEQRVKSLKIAIQCAKMLADTEVLCFYPSKFVLITDILDIFGHLVYHRLRTKADYIKPGSKATSIQLPENFTPDMVPDSAKETCYNWFYKIASIRELVPRVYIEMALLRCYNFLSTSDCPDALKRLTYIINGIGNPLVAVYARCYLTRIGLSVHQLGMSTQYLVDNFNEFLNTHHHLLNRTIKGALNHQQISISTYMSLFTPALDYMLEAVAECDNNENVLTGLLDRCSMLNNNGLVLNTIMSAFKPSSISQRSIQLLEMITNTSDSSHLPIYLQLRTLGLCLSVAPPPIEYRRPILSTVWQLFNTIKPTQDYIHCVETWVPFISLHFSCREVNFLLGNIVQHINVDPNYTQNTAQLKSIVEQIVNNITDFEALLSTDNILEFIEIFQDESLRVDVAKCILSKSFIGANKIQQISDLIVINTVVFLCGILHEAINALLPEDESRQIGEIICDVIRTVDYGQDFEQQLTFFVEARGAFCNLDPVLVQLVQSVNRLAIKTRQIVRGVHNKKTSDFVRACAAYTFITIPSIRNVKTRLDLYLLSGQVALFNHCLGQADACFKSAIGILNELEKDHDPRKSELFILDYVRKFFGTLIVVPDNPESSVLYLFRSLISIVQMYDWKSTSSLLQIYFAAIDVLCTMAQESYPYHIEKVEANDSLYGHDPKYITEIDNICSMILNEILSHLKQFGPSKIQSSHALDLFHRCIFHGEQNEMANLTMNLWNLAVKHQLIDLKYLVRTKAYLKKHYSNSEIGPISSLVQKIMETN